jgi:hypothetical protein
MLSLNANSLTYRHHCSSRLAMAFHVAEPPHRLCRPVPQPVLDILIHEKGIEFYDDTLVSRLILACSFVWFASVMEHVSVVPFAAMLVDVGCRCCGRLRCCLAWLGACCV